MKTWLHSVQNVAKSLKLTLNLQCRILGRSVVLAGFVSAIEAGHKWD